MRSAVSGWFLPVAPCALTGLLVLLVADGITTRSISGDEGTTMLQLSGNPRPVWPETPVPVEQWEWVLKGSANWREMTADLLETDIHPRCTTGFRCYGAI